jgi:hypothetical protein
MHERRERKKRTCIGEERAINTIGLIISNISTFHLSHPPSSIESHRFRRSALKAEVVNPDPYFSCDGPNPLTIS